MFKWNLEFLKKQRIKHLSGIYITVNSLTRFCLLRIQKNKTMFENTENSFDIYSIYRISDTLGQCKTQGIEILFDLFQVS